MLSTDFWRGGKFTQPTFDGCPSGSLSVGIVRASCCSFPFGFGVLSRVVAWGGALGLKRGDFRSAFAQGHTYTATGKTIPLGYFRLLWFNIFLIRDRGVDIKTLRCCYSWEHFSSERPVAKWKGANTPNRSLPSL